MFWKLSGKTNAASLKANLGEYTPLIINRTGYLDENGQQDYKKYKNPVAEMRKQSLGDRYTKELICTINHRGSGKSASDHWVCYSSLEDTGVWFVNSDSKRIQQSRHPFNVKIQDQTVDFLLYLNK